jgi:hypothetical protein
LKSDGLKEETLKFLFRIPLIFALLLLGGHTTLACSCVVNSLGKRFREAKAVFVGRAVSNEPTDNTLIQNNSNKDNYAQTLEVVKGYKGIREKFISVTFDEESLKGSTMCPTLYQFEQNREYLVFAYGKNYQVQTVCSDTWEIPSDKKSSGYEQMQSYIKQLGSFWFRFRATLNPF